MTYVGFTWIFSLNRLKNREFGMFRDFEFFWEGWGAGGGFCETPGGVEFDKSRKNKCRWTVKVILALLMVIPHGRFPWIGRKSCILRLFETSHIFWRGGAILRTPGGSFWPIWENEKMQMNCDRTIAFYIDSACTFSWNRLNKRDFDIFRDFGKCLKGVGGDDLVKLPKERLVQSGETNLLLLHEDCLQLN